MDDSFVPPGKKGAMTKGGGERPRVQATVSEDVREAVGKAAAALNCSGSEVVQGAILVLLERLGMLPDSAAVDLAATEGRLKAAAKGRRRG